jgi:hypothetical protein
MGKAPLSSGEVAGLYALRLNQIGLAKSSGAPQTSLYGNGSRSLPYVGY